MGSNGNLKFSVVLEAVTNAFNTAMNQAKDTYTTATASVKKDSATLSSVTAAAAVDLKKVFQAGDARTITEALKSATKELDSLKGGATLSATELKRVGVAGKQAMGELKAELTQARAELQALTTAKATPADIENARKKVSELVREVGGAGASYQRFQAAATAAMGRVATTTQEAADKARSAGKAIYDSLNLKTGGTLRQEIAQITQQLSEFKNKAGAPAEEINRITKSAEARITSLKNELRGVSPAADGAATSVRGMGSSLLGLTGATAGLAGVAAGLKAIVDTAIQFQSVNKQLEYAAGSAKRAAEEFEFVKKTANELGLDLLSAADGYAKLAAATKGTSLEGKATRDIFLGVSQAAATMGLSVADAEGVFRALSQIAGKGKVSMEELRGQLGERLPPAMKIAADSMGVTVQRLNQLVENGLDADEFLSAFGPALQKAFSADAAKNVDTLQGRINLLRNEFKSMLNDLGDGGVADSAVRVFKDLTNAINTIRTKLQDIDPRTVDAVKAAFDSLYSIVEQVFSTLFSAVADASGALDSMMQLVTGVVSSFTGFSDAGEQVSFLTRVLQGVGITLGAISDGVYTIRIAFTAVTGVVQSFFSAIASGLSKVTFGAVSKELKDLASQLSDAGQKSFDKADELAQNFQSQTVAAMDRAVQANEDAAQKSADAHEKAGKRAADAQSSVGDAAVVAGATVGAAAQGAAQQLQYVGDKAQVVGGTLQAAGSQGAEGLDAVGAAAVGAKQKIDIFAGAGGTAIINTANATNDVKKAFADLAKEAGVQLPAAAEKVADLGLAMGTVAAKSKQAADGIAKELPEAVAKLNAVQLLEFQTAFVGGLEKAGASADYVKARVIDLATAAAKSLGVDLGSSLNGLTEQFKQSIGAVQSLATNFDKLMASGVDSSKVLVDGLTAVLDKAKNPVEIQELIGLWENLESQGKVTGDELVLGLEKARAKLDELKPGVNSVAEAFKVFGLQTKADAQRVYKNYQEAFTKLESSGTASFSQLQEAFKKYAQSSIDANGGVADSFLISKAEAYGLKFVVDETGRSIIKNMKDGAAAVSGLGSAARSAANEFSLLQTNADMAANAAARAKINSGNTTKDEDKKRKDDENKRLNRDSDGFSTNDKGERITAGNDLGSRIGIIGFLQQAGVDNLEAAKKIANEFADAYGNIPYFSNPGQGKYGGSTLSAAVLKAAEQYVYQDKGTATGNAGGSAALPPSSKARLTPPPPGSPPAPTGNGAGGGKTIAVNFNLGGSTVAAQINANDEAAFLSMLEKARGVA